MRTALSALMLAVTMTVRAAAAWGAIAPADVARVVSLAFAGGPGAAGGDVNADGRASAADICGVLAGLRSPTQPGTFGVGVQRVTFTKDSLSHPGTPRTLRTTIWYPANPGAAPVAPTLGGVVNAPLADGLANAPLLMFSHGSCGYPEQSIFFTALMASYGFIVAAPPHPGNTISQVSTCGSEQAVADSYVDREDDIEFVITSLLALNNEPASFLYGAIDPARIGMSGHSFGGQTTLRVCAGDPRVVAGLAMAPALTPTQSQVQLIDIPMMIQAGTIDAVLSFEGNARAAYDLLRAPRYLLEIQNTGHYAFSDVCAGSTDCAPGTLTQDEAHLYVLRYAVPYLLRWVAGDPRFDAFLAPGVAAPGSILTADVGG